MSYLFISRSNNRFILFQTGNTLESCNRISSSHQTTKHLTIEENSTNVSRYIHKKNQKGLSGVNFCH